MTKNLWGKSRPRINHAHKPLTCDNTYDSVQPNWLEEELICREHAVRNIKHSLFIRIWATFYNDLI
jgi:hypothetical protein